MNTLLRAAAMAGGLIAAPLFAANNPPGPATPKSSIPVPAIPTPSLIKSLQAPLYKSVTVMVDGSVGDLTCAILIQRQPVGQWDPVTFGMKGVVVIVGKSQPKNLPLNIAYGSGLPPADTVGFIAKGVAVNGHPACAGQASANMIPVQTPPPPPDVSS